jgi:hypothetical protein
VGVRSRVDDTVCAHRNRALRVLEARPGTG